MPGGRTAPTLGPRGEGWVVLQVPVLLAVAAGGTFGPAWEGPPRLATTAVGAALVVAGTILAALGVRALGAALTPLPMPAPGARLVEHGPFRLVRHPIYGGIVLGGIGWGLATAAPAALIAAVVAFAFFDLKTRREERWLAERFPGYRTYQARTRRLVPWLY